MAAVQVVEVKGFGRQKDYLQQYRDTEFELAFLTKVEITMWIDDYRINEVVDCLVEAARSGRMGDGKIWIQSIAERIDMT